MWQRQSLDITIPAGRTIQHGLVTHDQPGDLLVLLPGRGYTADMPLLHYLRKAAADLGYDVLSLWYSFQLPPYEYVPDPALIAEIDQAIKAAMQRGYRRLIVAGKSMGTPLAVRYADRAERLILLTPIGTAAPDAGSKPTLAVIGTADSFYQPDQVKTSGANVEWLVLDDLDHGLEKEGDWSASLDALRQVTAACVKFLS